jgi:hypothetical protein
MYLWAYIHDWSKHLKPIDSDPISTKWLQSLDIMLLTFLAMDMVRQCTFIPFDSLYV